MVWTCSPVHIMDQKLAFRIMGPVNLTLLENLSCGSSLACQS
uniref:Uncharacterized protein n=1 Tax=Arundo donax TaxID=35708 RepID=A0A0A8YUL4_ARUDO